MCPSLEDGARQGEIHAGEVPFEGARFSRSSVHYFVREIYILNMQNVFYITRILTFNLSN